MTHSTRTLLAAILSLFGCASNEAPLEKEPLSRLIDSFGYEDLCPVNERNVYNDKVQAVIVKNKGVLLDAYQDILSKQPDLEGTIYLYTALESNGEVSKMEVLKDTLGNSQLKQTTVKLIGELKFPPASNTEPREFCYPIHFNPT